MAEMDRQQSLPETVFRTADQMARRIVSTGNASLDTLLGGGLEIGLMHLFYGDRCLTEDLLRAAVQVQLPEERGGMNSPTIIIDSANIIKIEKLTDFSFEMGFEPEDVMDHIYISRAFNSSQTYDLVMNQLEQFFERVPARLLIVSGLPDLYIAEGTTGEGLQQISHMATKLMAFTLNRGIATLLSAPASERNPSCPLEAEPFPAALRYTFRLLRARPTSSIHSLSTHSTLSDELRVQSRCHLAPLSLSLAS